MLTSLLYGNKTWTLYHRHIRQLGNFRLPNGRIQYQTSLSLSSVKSPASSRYCFQLSFVGVAMSLACQMTVYTSACYTANFQMSNVIQVVSGRDTETSFVSVSEPVKLTIYGMGRTGNRQIRLEGVVLQRSSLKQFARVDVPGPFQTQSQLAENGDRCSRTNFTSEHNIVLVNMMFNRRAASLSLPCSQTRAFMHCSHPHVTLIFFPDYKIHECIR